VRIGGGPLSKNPNPEKWNITNLTNSVHLLETDSECDDSLHGTWQCESCESHNACLFKNIKMIFNITLCGKWAGNQFDSTDTALTNCRTYIFGSGRQIIHNQFIKLEYISVSNL
jgi:hypothetical protein